MSPVEVATEVTTRVSVDVIAATEARQHRLRILLGLEREENAQLKALHRTLEKKCEQYEAIVADLLAQLEGHR